MPAKKHGILDWGFSEIADQLGFAEYVIRKAENRGLLDIADQDSLILYCIYKSTGEFRQKVNRAIIAWDDWYAGKNPPEPDLLAVRLIESMTLNRIWHNESKAFAERVRRAYDNDPTALAITPCLELKQQKAREKRKEYRDSGNN